MLLLDIFFFFFEVLIAHLLYFFFFLMIRPPPRPTLFPYTPLFRSYPIPPRWGFPRLSWRRLAWVPGTPAEQARPAQRVAALASSLVPALWITAGGALLAATAEGRSEEHTSELQSHLNLVCRLLLEK